jgi:hypothetical protein
MSGEINVLSRTQVIVVEPTSGSVSVINAGPGGGIGGGLPGGGNEGDILTREALSGVGWHPPIIHHKLDAQFDITPRLFLIGEAELGSATSDPAWTIEMIALDDFGEMTDSGWSPPNSVWDDRALLTYTNP